jgi:hypothetical protein
VKRAEQPFSWNTCKVIAVADYKFYRFIGGNDIYSTAAYIVSPMSLGTSYTNLGAFFFSCVYFCSLYRIYYGNIFPKKSVLCSCFCIF